MNNNLGELVKERRAQMGMSLREFAAFCGVSHTHIDSIEKGYDVRSGRKVNLTAKTVDKLTSALGIEQEMPMDLGEKAKIGMPSDTELKFALFGDGRISDEMLDEVKKFAEFIKTRDSSRT